MIALKPGDRRNARVTYGGQRVSTPASVLLAFLTATSAIALNHPPQWLSSTTCSYGLPSAYVNEYPAAGYWMCRFGNYLTSDNALVGRETLNFNYLTTGPFSIAGMDNEHSGGLFVWNTDLSPAQRVTFSSLSASSWVAPAGNAAGSVEIDGSITQNRDLYRHFTMTDDQLPGISSSTRKYVIVIHGWNPDGDDYMYGESYWSDLVNRISTWLTAYGGSSWKLLKYRMERDADTGENDWDPVPHDAAINGAEAAEIARLHGYHMAQLILEKSPNVQAVHLIAHSAGSWAARSCLRYLLANHPTVKCQLTLLDAFMPDEIDGIDSNLGEFQMDSIASFAGSARIFRCDNYYSAWNLLHDPSLGTASSFTWGSLESGLDDVCTSDPGVNQWRGHDGPIQYYADSVASVGAWSYPGGWEYSLPYQDVLNIDAPAALTAKAISASQINLSWQDVSDEIGYRVERRLGINGSWQQIATRGENVPTYSDMGLATGTLYYYRVLAYKKAGNDSQYSPLASATTQAGQPATGTSHTLTIASVNPSSGVGVSSYVGAGQYTQSVTTTTRSFAHGSGVGVNCFPSTLASGYVFQKWLLDGEDYDYTASTVLYLDRNRTLTAVYGATPLPPRNLSSLTIEGPSSVDERSSEQYRARANYSDGSSGYVIASWDDDSSFASISPSGLLDADSVSSEQDVEIEASFTLNGVTRSDTKVVTIENTDAVPTYTLTRNSTAGGSIGQSPSGTTFAEGTVVSLHGNPDDDYVFSHWTGDASGTEDDITITMNGNRSVTAHFTLDTTFGRLQVNLSPQEVVVEGAQWKYNNFTEWQNSGVLIDGITPRTNKNVYFKDIPGWITPANVKASVFGGQTTITNATYREILGAVQVTIYPAQASSAGARWRLDGGGWTESGVTLPDVSTGNHSIQFQSIPGWTSPTSQMVSVTRGVTSVRNGDYVPPVGFPIITAVYPRTSPIAGGTVVTIEGANFQPGASVTFGGVVAATVTVVNATRITAVTPPRASYGTVALSLDIGGQVLTQANGFSYLNALGSNIELVGQIGGRVNAVAVSGSTVYYGEGPALVVADYSNSSAPVERGRIALPNVVTDVVVVNNIAFVTAGGAGLYAVDVSLPTSPAIVGFFDTEGSAQGVSVINGFAYVADATVGLQILNVTNPAAIVRIGLLDTAGTVMRVSAGTIASRQYAFVAEGNIAMRVIDVTVPSAPLEVANVPAQGGAGITDVKIVGTRLYLSDWQSVAKIYDASNPTNLIQIGSRSSVGAGAFIDIVSNRLYTCTGNSLRVADLSVLPTPTNLGTFDFGSGYSYKVVVTNGLAYIAAGPDGLKAVNVSNPAAMSLRSSLQTIADIEDVWLSGKTALIGNGLGLHTVNVSNPASPRRIATLAGDRVTDIVEISGKATLVNYGDEVVRIANVANPAAPVLLGTYTNAEAWNVALLETSPVLAAATRDASHLPKLDVLNISSPATPQSSGSVILASSNGIANAIAIVSNWAFVGRSDWSGWPGGIDIVNLANPESPVKVGSVSMSVPIVMDVAASPDANYLYVPSLEGIRVYDVTTKTLPVLSSTVAPPQVSASLVHSVHIAEHRLYAEESGFLFVFDISSPVFPQLVGYYDLPGWGYGIAVTNDVIFVAGSHAGVTILRLNDIDKPTLAITSPTMNTTFATTNESLLVRGTASDNKGVARVTWLNDRGGGDVAQGTTTWAITNLQLAAGLNRITVTAEDADGNLGTDTLDITATFQDTTPPVVKITGPKPEAEFAVDTPTITLSGSAADNQSIGGMACSNNLSAAGVVMLSGQNWSVTDLQLAAGANFIQVSATDLSGNCSTDTAVVFLVAADTNIPLVNIDFPTPNAFFETSIGAINLSGVAEDDGGVENVEWTTSVGTQGVANGISPWSINAIVLKPGFNLIEVRAKDRSGNVAGDALAVVYTPPAVALAGVQGMSNGVFNLGVSGPWGANLVVESSSNLLDWLPLSTNVIPGEDAISITAPITGDLPILFYRATSVSP